MENSSRIEKNEFVAEFLTVELSPPLSITTHAHTAHARHSELTLEAFCACLNHRTKSAEHSHRWEKVLRDVWPRPQALPTTTLRFHLYRDDSRHLAYPRKKHPELYASYARFEKIHEWRHQMIQVVR